MLETGTHPTYLGTFDTAKEAALAYDQAAIKKGNKKSTLNFPEGEKEQEKQEKQEKQTVVEKLVWKRYQNGPPIIFLPMIFYLDFKKIQTMD